MNSQVKLVFQFETYRTCRSIQMKTVVTELRQNIALGSPATWLLTQVDLRSLPSVTVCKRYVNTVTVLPKTVTV